MTTKDLLEIMVLLGGGGGALFTGGFWFASMRAELRIKETELRVTDFIATTNLKSQEFVRKATQNINRNMVEIGLLKTEIKDIKRVLSMHRATTFPEENKPPHTEL